MTHFVLWQHSLRHPVCSVVYDRPLSEHERKTKLCEPIAIRESDAVLPLDVLARLYPHTNATRTAKIRAVADDVRGDPNSYRRSDVERKGRRVVVKTDEEQSGARRYMGQQREVLDITLCVIRETPKAWLVFDVEEQVEADATWMPKSVAEQYGEKERKGRYMSYEFSVFVWFCRQTGWI